MIFIFREVFVNNETGKLYVAGETMKRLKLADTLEAIANESANTFYNGTIADKIVRELQQRGGIITKQDLIDYHVSLTDALTIDFNSSLTVHTAQAPSSGPILTFILNILQGYHFHEDDLKQTTTAALFYHRLTEAFKFAYAKRSELGDPEKINITDVSNRDIVISIFLSFLFL